MKILITGITVFVIWSAFSTWLYIDKIRPAMIEPVAPVAVQTIPEKHEIAADSLTKTDVIMPESFMVYFDFDRFQFNPDQKTDNSAADCKSWLEKNPGSTLIITGHTDLAGTDAYNQALGLKRAQAIQQYLEGKGIPAARIVASSKGESQPVGDNKTPEGRASNRRGEISVNK